jgi:hypothetical protein
MYKAIRNDILMSVAANQKQFPLLGQDHRITSTWFGESNSTITNGCSYERHILRLNAQQVEGPEFNTQYCQKKKSYVGTSLVTLLESVGFLIAVRV